MLNAIFSPHFWFTQQFNNEEHDFGGFRDMLSASAEPGSEFTIGAHQIHQLKDGKAKREGFVASFRDHEGLPVCSFFSRIDDLSLTAIKSSEIETYQYSKSQMPNDYLTANAADIFTYIENWKSDTKTIFKNISKKIPGRLGLVPLMQVATTLEAEKSDSEIDFSGMETTLILLQYFASLVVAFFVQMINVLTCILKTESCILMAKNLRQFIGEKVTENYFAHPTS